MGTMGQLTYLPQHLADNPFHPLLVKFSRVKMGSWESLFNAERYLLRYSWLGLLALFALVLPNLEEVDYLSTAIRLATLLYPCFFIWSLTRLAGVELMQLVLEGHWTGEVLATPVTNRDLLDGFVSPIWLTVRQYLLISFFSLVLYGLERNVILVVDDEILYGDCLRHTIFYIESFMIAVAWIIFIYLARLLAEVRLRNGLIKGLSTVALFGVGCALIFGYCLFFFRYSRHMTDTVILIAMGAIIVSLMALSIAIHACLARRFRQYLAGQLDIDLLIYDDTDPHATAWTKVE